VHQGTTGDSLIFSRSAVRDLWGRIDLTQAEAIRDLIEYRRQREKLIVREQEVAMPTEHGEFKLHLYRSLVDNQHHCALVMGKVRGKQNVLVRVHSECLTGDVFGSQRCDCGQQLHEALSRDKDTGYTTSDPKAIVAIVEKRFRKLPNIVKAVSELKMVKIYGDPTIVTNEERWLKQIWILP
jgi:hypothetical protein